MENNNKKLKIVVASGKGGVGKSMLASSLTILFSKAGKKIVAIDSDVDAPNLAIWLGGVDSWDVKKQVSTIEKPIINLDKCNGCGLCVKNCQFHALSLKNKKAKLNNFLCEGCGVCKIVCPQNAIKMEIVNNAEINIKNQTKYGFPLISAQLFPGESGSGKIVAEAKKEAEKFEYDSMIIDSAPGTGCPVNAALFDANFVVLVTEPTPSGFSDLEKILAVVKHFKIPYRLVINKWDMNPQFSQKVENQFKDKILGKISYDQKIFRAISNLTPIMETNLKAKKEIEAIFKRLTVKITRFQV
jgi:MinD superfamily P-loop ATPase